MRESCHQFGDRAHLAGIVTEPEGAPRASLILVSAGLTPKAGPFRLYVELARRLAKQGVLTLRFDLGGIGDSRQLEQQAPLAVRTRDDIAAAYERIAQAAGPRGSGPIFVGGLCSGAEDAFRYAGFDPRVSGVVLIDPFGYPTWGFRWRRWMVEGAKKTLGALRFYRRAESEAQPSLVDYRYLEKAESEEILASLIARKSSVHFFYTGGSSSRFNYPGQLKDMFSQLELGAQVTVDHLPRLGHTQLLAEDRATLIGAIARRLE